MTKTRTRRTHRRMRGQQSRRRMCADSNQGVAMCADSNQCVAMCADSNQGVAICAEDVADTGGCSPGPLKMCIFTAEI